jgi:hypothetical protein
MQHIDNPFAPGAGTQPPELAGRRGIVDDASVALERVRLRRPARSQIFVGLRGVGKTVLLNRIREIAEQKQFETLMLEIHEDVTLPALLVPPLRKILLRLDFGKQFGEKTKRGLRILRSFIGTFKTKFKVGELAEVELGVEAERGQADSGVLENDLPDLLIAVAEAAVECSTSICLLLDELQYLSERELSALIMALHQINQRNLPLLMMGAGLPHILGLAGKSKSYAERLFTFPALGPLSPEASTIALQEPAIARSSRFTDEALAEIIRVTQGYPYFLQQWGYEAWNVAPATPITAKDVEAATVRAIRQLDESFFRVRFDRLTRREKEFLFAMLAVGGSQQRSGEIAEKMGVKANAVSPLRATLIRKGMIYSPAYGDTAFTVPFFDAFLERQLANPLN